MATYNNLEQGLNKLTVKFRKDLINRLSQRGHNESGKLRRSIDFIIKRRNDNTFTLELQSLDYIKYLEKGKFLEDFLKEKEEELLNEIPKLIESDIINQLNLK